MLEVQQPQSEAPGTGHEPETVRTQLGLSAQPPGALGRAGSRQAPGGLQVGSRWAPAGHRPSGCLARPPRRKGWTEACSSHITGAPASAQIWTPLKVSEGSRCIRGGGEGAPWEPGPQSLLGRSSHSRAAQDLVQVQQGCQTPTFTFPTFWLSFKPKHFGVNSSNCIRVKRSLSRGRAGGTLSSHCCQPQTTPHGCPTSSPAGLLPALDCRWAGAGRTSYSDGSPALPS